MGIAYSIMCMKVCRVRRLVNKELHYQGSRWCEIRLYRQGPAEAGQKDEIPLFVTSSFEVMKGIFQVGKSLSST